MKNPRHELISEHPEDTLTACRNVSRFLAEALEAIGDARAGLSRDAAHGAAILAHQIADATECAREQADVASLPGAGRPQPALAPVA